MFLIHTLLIFVAIYMMSAVLAEVIFSSETERKLPTAVQIGFSYLLSLLYFTGAWVCMSIRQAWILGIIILTIYAYGKFGNLFIAFARTQFGQLLKKNLLMLGGFLILANIFFLPLHWDRQYGPFTERGGDITVYSDIAKRLDDFNLSAAGFGEGASLEKRIDHIKHMLNVTYTDEYLAMSPDLTNPPDSDYRSTALAFNFSIHSSIYTPFAQFHFLSGDTNYPAYFAVQAFLYACLITSVFGFFRSFGWVPAIFATLLFIGSHSYVSSLYNHYTIQALSVLILGLFLGAVPYIRLFSTTGLKTYFVGITICWIANYNHFIPIFLPLMTLATLYWFYPKPTEKNKEDEPKRNWLQKLCFYMGWGSLIIFALITHATALKNSLAFFNGVMASFQSGGSGGASIGNSLVVFSERWWSQILGFLSFQHFHPFVQESKLVQEVLPWGNIAAFLLFATGLAMVIASRLRPVSTASTVSNKDSWHLIGIYTALISTVLLYTPVSQLSIYIQAKSAQYLLTCTYFILLLPFIIFFRSDKSFWTYFRFSKKSDWKFILSLGYMASLICFTVALLIPRVVYLEKDGNQEHFASILTLSYFSEAKKIISQDDKAFVLFEPRNSSDIYFGNQPFSGYRVVPTRYMILRRYDKSTEGSKEKYIATTPSELIEPEDLPHLWKFSSDDNRSWKGRRLTDQKTSELYFFGDVYEKNRKNNGENFSFIINGSLMIYLPPGGPYSLEVKILNGNANRYKKEFDMIVQEISKLADNGELESLINFEEDGYTIKLDFFYDKSNSPRFSLISKVATAYLLNVSLNGQEVVLK